MNQITDAAEYCKIEATAEILNPPRLLFAYRLCGVQYFISYCPVDVRLHHQFESGR
jgi:hypothetical protein